MIRTKILLTFLTVAVCQCGWATEAEAGPLLDWLRNRRCQRCAEQCNPCQTPVAACPTPAATCQTTCMQTCSRVVVNYVPCTAYRTSWERVPVTQYRQTSSTDPCTGCTVTCNRPCTTYTWRMKQTPYTTYRPVYRRETYQVPVTYTTQMAQSPSTCDTGSCATGSCATGVVAAPVQVQAPAGTIQPNGLTPYYQSSPGQESTIIQQPSGTPTPADLQPSLSPQDMQRPILESPTTASPALLQPSAYPSASGISPAIDPDPELRWQENSAPQLLNPFNKTTRAPSVQRWDYSPVRLASYVSAEPNVDHQTGGREYIAQTKLTPVEPQRRVNQGWRSGSR